MSPLPNPTLAPPSFEPEVQEFQGKLLDVKLETVNGAYGARSVAKLQFSEVEVFATRSGRPYNFPTLEIDVNYTPDRRQTPWDGMRASMVPFLPASNAEEGINFFIGHVTKFKWMKGGVTLRVNLGNNTWAEDESAKYWNLLELDGVAVSGAVEDITTGKDIYQVCAEMINGKNITEFSQEFYSNQQVRNAAGYSDAVSELVQNKLAQVLIEKGLVSENADGTYSKIG